MAKTTIFCILIANSHLLDHFLPVSPLFLLSTLPMDTHLEDSRFCMNFLLQWRWKPCWHFPGSHHAAVLCNLRAHKRGTPGSMLHNTASFQATSQASLGQERLQKNCTALWAGGAARAIALCPSLCSPLYLTGNTAAGSVFALELMIAYEVNSCFHQSWY